MKVLKLDLEKLNFSEDVISEAVDFLQAGGIVMHPTETCYGLAVDLFNSQALEKLYRVKKMPAEKPVSILVSGLEMAEKYGEFSEKARAIALKYWPGPLSIMVPRKEKSQEIEKIKFSTEGSGLSEKDLNFAETLPDFFNSASDFVSIRFSSDRFSQILVEKLGRPITTTSANISGDLQLYAVDIAKIPHGVDLVIDAGELSQKSPSTIVKVVDDRLEVIREGDLEISFS